MTIEFFTPEVCKELKYYVYRLIDPRNGHTFYVGKGKGNRIFAHINDALKNYKGENFQEDGEDNISDKIQTIRDIKNDGLEVIHVIQRYGLDEKEAFEVEAALIDAFPGLTNLQSGHYNERGVINAYTLQQNLSLETFEEPENLKYMLIKIKWDRVNYCKECNPSLSQADAIYEATRYSWKINPNKAAQYEYVLSIIDGIVEGVYKVKEWKLSDNGVRYEFDRTEPDEKIVKHFYKKRIPDSYTKKGMANPVLYHG